VLVSQWEVDSAATAKLITTAMGALAKDKSLGRAEALCQAMLSVMADTSRPSNWVPASHPSVWAPFVVVGEGGASFLPPDGRGAIAHAKYRCPQLLAWGTDTPRWLAVVPFIDLGTGFNDTHH
jgi:CHAT domain-containing protein